MRRFNLALLVGMLLLLVTGCDPDSPVPESLVSPFMNDVYPRLMRQLS